MLQGLGCPLIELGIFVVAKYHGKAVEEIQFLLHISLDKAIDHSFMCHISQLSDSVKFENLDLITTSFQHGNSLPPR